MQKNDFFINLKNEEFTIVYDNINHFFTGNYLRFITNIKQTHSYLTDLIVLLRKYQFFFQEIYLNNSILCCFNRTEGINNLLLLDTYLSPLLVNSFIFFINLQPKFQHNELNFEIPNKLIKLKITVNTYWVNDNKANSFKLESSEVEAINFNTIFTKKRYVYLNQVLSQICNIILNDFRVSPFKGLNHFLNQIENYFPEIFKKEEEISKLNDNKNLQIKVEQKNEKTKEPKINNIQNIVLNSTIQNNELNFNNTNDIIHEIITVYHQKYANYNLNEIENIQKKTIDHEIKYEEENDRGENNLETNKQMLDIYLSTNLQPSLSLEDINHFQSILLFGDKYKMNIDELSMLNIGIANLITVKLLLKCSGCKTIAFEANYQKIDKKEDIFYMGTRCTKCDNEMFSIFKSEYLHEQNVLTSGIVYIIGCFVIDFLPCTFSLSCLECQETKKVKLRSGTLHFKDSKCHNCFSMLEFRFQSFNIIPTLESDVSFLKTCSIIHFSKYNFGIKDDINLNSYVKSVYKVIQEGKPLPLFGTCLHYKQSFRWFRFNCCHKLFPCDNCHNQNSDHICEIAKTILCGYCAFEQPSNNTKCSKCSSSLIKIVGGNGFWEGGKGCRNKLFMSSKDSHKYTDSKMKTISKKKKNKGY